jgi:uncharacterized protein YndB with AHSA1/START domain
MAKHDDTAEQDYTAAVRVAAKPEAVFAALTTLEGLSAWWTATTGDATGGGTITFHFGPESRAVMQVEAADPQTGVRWRNTDCVIADWIGTTQTFDLARLADGGTEIRFRHHGLTPRLACYGDCKNGWDHFIPSLAAYVETGTGHPNGSPADVARREARANGVGAGAA